MIQLSNGMYCCLLTMGMEAKYQGKEPILEMVQPCRGDLCWASQAPMKSCRCTLQFWSRWPGVLKTYELTGCIPPILVGASQSLWFHQNNPITVPAVVSGHKNKLYMHAC